MLYTQFLLYFVGIFLCLFTTSCAVNTVEKSDLDIYPETLDHQQNTKVVSQKSVLEATTFTIETLIDSVLLDNPEIKAARYKWKAAEEKYPQVTSLPDPMLTYSHFLRNVETRVGPQNHSLSFSQNIPFPRKLYFQGEVAKNDAHIAYLAYEKTIRNTIIKAQQSFYELAYLYGAIEITKKNEDVLSHLLQVAVTENSKSNAPNADVMKGEAQLAQLGYDRIRLDELRIVEEAQLNALLNRNSQAKVHIDDFYFLPTQKILDFEILHKHAIHNNQEILAANIAIDKADNQISLAFAQYFPDVSVGFTWIQIDKTLSGFNFNFDDDGQDAFAITFGMNLPIWQGKRSAQVQESKWNMESATETKRHLENQLAAELKKVYYKVSNSERLVTLYQERLLPEAENSMRVAENWYRDGKGSMMGVFETQNVWLNFSLALLRAQTEYAQGMTEIAKLCGGNLPNLSTQEEN